MSLTPRINFYSNLCHNLFKFPYPLWLLHLILIEKYFLSNVAISIRWKYFILLPPSWTWLNLSLCTQLDSSSHLILSKRSFASLNISRLVTLGFLIKLINHSLQPFLFFFIFVAKGFLHPFKKSLRLPFVIHHLIKTILSKPGQLKWEMRLIPKVRMIT